MEKVVRIADRYVCIQECDNGFDFNIYNTDFVLLEGGVIETENETMEEVLDGILTELRDHTGYASIVFGEVRCTSVVGDVKEIEVLRRLEEVA